MRNLVTGGAGFLGSHLIDKLLSAGEEVVSLDNYFTGSKSNLKKWFNNNKLEIIRHDITQPILLEADRIWHLACPASPIHYQNNPIKTAKTSFLGTYNMLGLAKRLNARFLLASTSEIYGNPLVHPQKEAYFGNVNTIGPRSCYDEGKRIAETLCFDYKRMHNSDIRVVRIFNTYGPRMLPNDGRVVSNFIVSAISGNPLTIYGDGSQTRSFCYVDDLINGMLKLMNSNYDLPVNLGNPDEFTVKDLAKILIKKVNPDVKLIYKNLPEDDPLRRKPDISIAKEVLNWEPSISLSDGLDKTIKYFKDYLKNEK
ncbi:SDR family oxidoreductase [Prochlorococcus marinus XMU1406]|uniref:UDP-glucuronic acid decarboxylase family protein n=1 Tax=Prochlorococcus marinus TaxID=1219 RepID=UPI001ADBBF7E|nr:SDR family oxidoreductase [Prochlorococcus marinus XMU1406]MCR8542622.1 SDR family oxidoreductase [Prochlorococcus marinus XMU1427]